MAFFETLLEKAKNKKPSSDLERYALFLYISKALQTDAQNPEITQFLVGLFRDLAGADKKKALSLLFFEENGRPLNNLKDVSKVGKLIEVFRTHSLQNGQLIEKPRKRTIGEAIKYLRNQKIFERAGIDTTKGDSSFRAYHISATQQQVERITSAIRQVDHNIQMVAQTTERQSATMEEVSSTVSSFLEQFNTTQGAMTENQQRITSLLDEIEQLDSNLQIFKL